MDRREFIEFLGYGSFALAGSQLISSCSSTSKATTFPSINPTLNDALELAPGFTWERMISWGDKINATEYFGHNNDYIDYIPLPGKTDEYLLWVNNEYVGPLMPIVSGKERTKENIDIERAAVGASVVHIKKVNGSWKVQFDSKHNKRITGETKIPFSNNHVIKGSNIAEGTINNCSGGKTPWNTILTCEENYNYCYGDKSFSGEEISPAYDKWNKFYPNPPEHYGWVVEVDPVTMKAEKRVEMGRFMHECALVVQSQNGLVVYSGDDARGEHIYKFVSDYDKNLSKGTLYVADIKKGKWLPLDITKDKRLEKFKTQKNVMVYAREAAKIVGATPLDRPEDIELNPINGDIVFTLTNNKKTNNHHGKICKISENGNYASTDFTYGELHIGGEEGGFSCPDNLAFDKSGNLWFATDISGSKIGKKQYKSFGNNGLFVVPARGVDQGKVIQIASAPVAAEFTGIKFSPDSNSMFLAVQHPGETSKSKTNLTSNWPFGGNELPRSSVVEIKSKFFQS